MTTADEESRKSLYYIPNDPDVYAHLVKFLARDVDKSYIQKGINLQYGNILNIDDRFVFQILCIYNQIVLIRIHCF